MEASGKDTDGIVSYPVSGEAIAARWGTAAIFFANGVVLGSWATCVPTVQQHLRLSSGELGIALLGMAIGSVPAMIVASPVTERFGSRVVSRVSALLMCVGLPFTALASNFAALFVVLLFIGAAIGILNVAENAQAAYVETRFRRPIMASFHAMFSLGGFAGAIVGSGMAAIHLPAALGLLIVSALLIVGVLRASATLLATDPLPVQEAQDVSVSFGQKVASLLGLGLIAFCSVVIEGAMADWSAVYIEKGVGASKSVAALGYATFALTMVVGRATGDKLGERYSDITLIRYGALLGVAGLGGALLLGGVPATLIGFAGIGLGCACTFPMLVRASGKLTHITPSAAIAGISSAGRFGFFVAPPVIGFLADHVTLRWALLVPVAANILILAMAPALAPSRAHRPAASKEAICS